MDNTTVNTLKDAAKNLDEKKAADILILDLQKASSYLSYFLIATSLSPLHTRNLANETVDFLKGKGYKLMYHDPQNFDSGWITLDFGEFIVHIFTEEKRKHYALDDYWKNAERIEWN